MATVTRATKTPRSENCQALYSPVPRVCSPSPARPVAVHRTNHPWALSLPAQLHSCAVQCSSARPRAPNISLKEWCIKGALRGALGVHYGWGALGVH